MLKRILAVLGGILIPFGLFYFTLWSEPWGRLFENRNVLTFPALLFAPVLSLFILIIPARFLTTTSIWIRGLVAAHALVMIILAVIGWMFLLPVVSALVDMMVLFAIQSAIGSDLKHFKKTLLWSVIFFFGVGTVWSFANIGMVAWRAETIAKDKPYCIQVASQTDPFAYESPKSLFDFFGLKMQARLATGGATGSYFISQHHAILVVENEGRTYRNWSYWKQDFVDEVTMRHLGRTPSIHCIPERYFAKNLPFIFEDKEKTNTVSFAGQSYSIPSAYRPRVEIKNKHTLLLTLIAPDFKPYVKTTSYSQYNYDVSIRQETGDYLSRILSRSINNSFFTSREVGEEFGLKKIHFFIKKGQELKKPRRTDYVYRTKTGAVTSLISCDLDNNYGLPCEHYFIRDKLVYTFQHTAELLSDWSNMERKLEDLINSFKEKGKAPS